MKRILNKAQFLASFFLSLIVLNSGLSFAQNPENTSRLNTQKTSKKASKKASATWNLDMMATDSRYDYNHKSVFNMSFGATVDYKLLEQLKLNIAPVIIYQTGHTQTEKEADKNDTKITVRNATADLKLGSYFDSSVGAVNQQKWHSEMLMDQRAFPAAQASVHNSAQSTFHGGLRGETGIATTRSLSTNTKEFEPTPTFSSGGVFANLNFDGFQWENSVSYFQFKNLPMSVATDSGLMGNTVNNTNGTDFTFKYEYQGIEYATKAKARFTTSLEYEIKGAFIRNNQAPSKLNQAYWISNGINIYASKNLMLTPTYEYFLAEPDAFVAAYSSENFTTNRAGYKAGLSLTMMKNFKISARGGERDVLYITPLQSRETIYEIQLETLDAPLL